jgi:D-alanine-D-alanine ligase-like ATP-grasp enzyme
MTKNIAILTGGTSSERDVSLRSAENMSNWVKTADFNPFIFDFPSQV